MGRSEAHLLLLLLLQLLLPDLEDLSRRQLDLLLKLFLALFRFFDDALLVVVKDLFERVLRANKPGSVGM